VEWSGGSRGVEVEVVVEWRESWSGGSHGAEGVVKRRESWSGGSRGAEVLITCLVGGSAQFARLRGRGNGTTGFPRLPVPFRHTGCTITHDVRLSKIYPWHTFYYYSTTSASASPIL
jgi:hypothetical protein